ncbi:hypothetical protein GGX14DRAFT_564233 [Mycena pura]|uniref:AAA+ ATPase domain-containing protein n=1 Tax=Mycena pura TaxID=153505 RepID=A0AAD6VLQ8_9AGAR|nr:hypothetical protein GGX14DRAFT_564233 [Mycena pura]
MTKIKPRPMAPAWRSAQTQPLGWNDDNWSDGGYDHWEGAAPTKPQPPRPCACTYMAPNAMQPKDVGENAQPSESTTEDDVIVDTWERKEHFLIREQIWFEGAQRWFPYDSSRYKLVVPKLELGNYFYVNRRHLMPGDEGNFVLTNFGETLLKFLRQVLIADELYRDSPECSTDTMLPDITILQSKIEDIGLHLRAEATESKLADKRAFAATLGCLEARTALHPESLVDQFLSELGEHLSVLTNYLLELYKPKAEKLALQLANGCIEFDLLIFYFQLGKRYCQDPDNINMASGFCLERRIYKKFEMEAKLIARGRLYTALSGIHYRSYHNERIMVDGINIGLANFPRPPGHYDHIMIDEIGPIPPPAHEVPDLPEEHLWLLPGFVYGFNLSRKMWSTFYVTEIEPVSFDHGAWDHLVLDPATKFPGIGAVYQLAAHTDAGADADAAVLPYCTQWIPGHRNKIVASSDLTRYTICHDVALPALEAHMKSLVQVTRNSNSFASKTISDVITGKGGGLFCVLHGPPGTGKTLTAEAVAEHLERPLYVVGTSELSTVPSELEGKLKSILDLATAWDAVLLIDEADVLLEQRSLHEIERNSLVSVVLRILEYHRGVLLLTTNRVKVFDAAFLSRFSIAIKYPEHDLHSRLVLAKNTIRQNIF